jgi:N-acetylmuramoyl-L-alanine amidase
MKRLIPFFSLLILAAASIVWAQGTARAKVRTAAGEKPVTMVQHAGQTLFPADEVLAAVGGTLARDPEGFKATLNNVEVAFATDSRYAIIGDELFEMPESPSVIDGRVFVPWQFFQGFFRAAIGMDVTWDVASSTLDVKPLPRQMVSAQASVVDLQGLTKIVIQLSAKTDYNIAREPGAYLVHLRSGLRSSVPEVAVENPLVSKIEFHDALIRIVLKNDEVTASSYRLEDPFRIILDLRHGSPTQPGVLAPSLRLPPVDAPGIRTIVIDPGHGGKEVGAIGASGLMEKDATLAISRKLVDILGRRLGTRVVLTRTGDELLGLEERTAIANQYKADLFVSIHVNAAIVRGAHGTETYFLSLDASDELARKVAERENASSPAASNAPASSDLKLILWDLAQQDYLKESSRLAELIQTEMNVLSGVQSRGVKQAPFKVLVGATMPAALVEVGFISNPDEEAKLQTDAFQSNVANALASAIEKYKNEYEVRIGAAAPPVATPAAAATTTSARSGV